MNSLTIAAQPDTPPVLSCTPAAVYVDGARRRDLEVLEWQELPAPRFGRAVLAISDVASGRNPQRLGDASRLPPVGSSVTIRHPSDPSGGQFACIVTAHHFTVSDGEETFTAECEHQLVSDLGGSVSSVWRVDGDGVMQVDAARIRFNTDTNALAESSPRTLCGRTCRVFDSGVSARPWTVADALGYFFATAVPAELSTPPQEELDALAGTIDLGTLDVTGKPLAQVLAETAARGGLEIRAAGSGRGLIVYQPGRQGRRRSVRLQPAGSRLSAAGSNLWRGAIQIRQRPSRPALLALGARKRYESTFELAKGWDPSLQTSRWRDFVRSESDHWPKLGDVYRKWVLNEHGWYCPAPWSLAVHSFAGIAAADFQTPSARQLLPCLSTDRQGRSLGVVVEIRNDADSSWRRWRGPLWVSESECAIYLGGDSLPGEYFQAARHNQAAVRVTATVEADARLCAEVQGDPALPTRVLDLSTRAAWRKVHTTSVFYGSQDAGAPGEVDESADLAAMALCRAEAEAGGTTAELTLAWVDASFHVGDLVDQIDGRCFDLASNPDTRPVVRAVRHEFADRQVTHLTVSG